MTNELDTTPIETARIEGRTTLTKGESKTLLASADIETPSHEVVENANGAVNAAESIGYPVVVKIASPAVQHKSEWADGAGVVLGLDSAEAVRSAAERILAAAATEEIEARVLVERAADIEQGTEVIVGGLRDASFGPTVLVGLGGVFTEVFEDTSHRLAPVDTDEARTAIEDLQAATLLRGYRERPAADLDALADTVCAVGDLVVEHDEIADVDVNPVLAGPDGALALDGLVTLTEVKN
jgi:succinyl-CoA synthetase beta subunit